MINSIRKALNRGNRSTTSTDGTEAMLDQRQTSIAFALPVLPSGWETLFEMSQSGMFVMRPDGRLVHVNAVLADMLGHKPEELAGADVRELVVPADLEPARAQLDARPWPVEQMREICLQLYMKGRGGTRTVMMRCRRVLHENANALCGSIIDVTDLRRGELALRDYARRLQLLSRQVIEVQENERCNLARELHDEIGQQLTLLKLSLEGLRHDAADPAYEQALESVDTLMRQVRDLSLDLRPSMLDDLGLVAALRWYVYRAARLADIKAEFVVPDDFPRMHATVETLFFRVAQEAITNVLRHSGAERVEIRLAMTRREIALDIRDDGRGFEPRDARLSALRGGSAGLLGMQERAALAGATLEIESSPGSGARLRLAIGTERAGLGRKNG